MLGLSTPISKFIQKPRKSSADSLLFQLHYILTTGILMTFVFIYCAKDFIGEPIRCLNSKSSTEDLRKTTETFCHIKSLYTVHAKDDLVTYRNRNSVHGKEIYIYPGVQKYNEDRHYIRRHSYYVWSSFYIFFLAILFYAPRYLWKKVDNGNLSIFSDKISKIISVKDVASTEFDELAQHFTNHLGHYHKHTILFLLCETLNIIMTVVSLILTNIFLGYEFFTYGSEVLKDIKNQNYDEFNHPMAMVKYFPTVAKCDWRQSGQSGSYENLDILCVLPLNNVNDKVYLFLWIYFILLITVSLLWLILWRMVPVMSVRARRMLLMNAIGRLTSRKERLEVADFVLHLRYTDWFALYQLRSQMDVVYYRAFVILVAKYNADGDFYEDHNA